MNEQAGAPAIDDGAQVYDLDAVRVGRGIVSPKPSMGVGSKTGLAGVIAAWGAAVTAGIAAYDDQGSAFYTDPSLVALVIAAIVATLGFVAARSSQANELVRAGAGAVQTSLDVLDVNREGIDEALAKINAELRAMKAGPVAFVPSAGGIDTYSRGPSDGLPPPDDVDQGVAA